MAPGLGERSTAYPGQLAWAAFDKTIHILFLKKGTQQQQNHTTENRIKQTNELIKKEKSDHSCISLGQDVFIFYLFFSHCFLEVVIL